MDEGIEHRKCRKCGCLLQLDVSEGINLCPLCGSDELQHQVFLELRDGFQVGEMQRLAVRDKRLPSRKNPIVDFTAGVEPQRATGSMVYKERSLDKKRTPPWYQEKVVDLRTGKILHECSEPLADHTEHGSASK